MTWSFGTIVPKSGSVIYATGVAPGGCGLTDNAPAASYGQLTDATEPSSVWACSHFLFGNLSPIASGSGQALVCGDDSSNYIYSSDDCYGMVAWSPSTYIFEKSYGSSIYVPSTCEELPREYEYTQPEYSCSGGSIIRGVKENGQCQWNGATLVCSGCKPRYAPEPCDSHLGVNPDTVTEAPVGVSHGVITVDGNGNAAGTNTGSNGGSGSSNSGSSLGSITNDGRHSSGGRSFRGLSAMATFGMMIMAASAAM